MTIQMTKRYFSDIFGLCPHLQFLAHSPRNPWNFLKDKNNGGDFPGGPVDKNPPANTGDTGLIPGPGRLDLLQSN